jgi:hypothetical protein
LLVEDARARIDRGAYTAGSGSELLVNYFVGQVVGSMTQVKPARRVIQEMIEGLADTMLHLNETMDAHA